MIRTAWYGRALFAAGTFLTATTGVGLWGWPGTVGEAFAWEIRAPLTAAWMGSWYVAAAWALAQGFREARWSRGRIALVVALCLTTTSLVATSRFFGEFRIGEGSGLEQTIAWIWLMVYVALPPAVVAVFAAHERRTGPEDRRPEHPLRPSSRAMLVGLGLTAGALGLWLTAVPTELIAVWPWKLNELSASIVGTWLITVAAGCAWGLRENDWSRCRIVLWPCLAALVLHLIALARLHATLTGSAASIALYAAGLAVAASALIAVGAAEARSRAGGAGGYSLASRNAVTSRRNTADRSS